jgi:thioredoxin 1
MISVNQQNFKQEVLESATPVLVHFGTPWCGLCRAINPLLMRLHHEWGEKIKLVGINPDENFHLAKTYTLKSLPTLILFENGKIMQRLEGFNRRDELLPALEKIPIRYASKLAALSDR